MNKKAVIIHRIIFALSVLPLAESLVFYLIKWHSLPRETGVHFAPDGSFDVVASKVYGFYPHLMGGLITAGIALAFRFIGKKSTGLRISEKGERLFRTELIFTLDIVLMTSCAIFTMWSFCVSLQKPLNARLAAYLMTAALIMVLIGVVIQVITCVLHRQKADVRQSTGTAHRLSRITGWLMTAGSAAMLAEVWNRLPIDDELYFDPKYDGLAYFANFDRFLDKRLLLIPLALLIIIQTALEIVSAKASRSGKRAAVSLTDKLRVINGLFFFYWLLMICSEASVGAVSVGIYAALTAASAAVYLIKRKSSAKAEKQMTGLAE